MRNILCGALMTLVASGAASAAMTDDFSSGLSNWSLYAGGGAYINTQQNPITTSGPQNKVAALILGSSANKFADMKSNETINVSAAGTETISFDMGYIAEGTSNYRGHYMVLTDATGTDVLTVGHAGNIADSTKKKFFISARDSAGTVAASYSPNGVIQDTNTWYHYELAISGSQVTLSIYSWASNNPDDYAGLSAVWTTTVSMLAGDYFLMFVNGYSHLSPDKYVSYRDKMYVDNVYVAVPEVSSIGLMALGGIGLLKRKH